MRPYYALAVLPLLTGCGSEPALKAVSTPVTRMRVETVTVAETDWPSTYEATATVCARSYLRQIVAVGIRRLNPCYLRGKRSRSASADRIAFAVTLTSSAPSCVSQ